MSEDPPFVTPFGTLLGEYQGVEGFSNGSDHHFSGEQNILNGITTGIKYQCVEYARRWLISKGLTFSGVSFAAHIWNLRHLERLSDKKLTTIKPVKNGSFFPPIPESFLIWKTAPDVPVGHIAVITEVNTEENYIRIAEQNVDNDIWPGNYSRQLKLESLDGGYFIRDEDEVFGWMIINFDVDSVDESELRLTDIVKKHEVNLSDQLWYDVTDPIEQKFVEAWGSLNDRQAYYTIESHIANKIQMATLECNYLSSLATKHALQSDEILKKLLIPEWLWPRLRESFTNYWESNGKFLITSIDFAFNGRTLKMVEYHGDSAFGIVEAAIFQEKWAKHYSCDIGKSSTDNVLNNLIQQCKDSLKGFVHIMIDNNPHHEYTAFFLQKVLNDAEISNKIIYGTNFVLTEPDKYVDSDGLDIKNVWKLWDWQTVQDN